MGFIQPFFYGALTVVAFVQWRRHPGPASAWLCAAFTVLGAVLIAGRVLPEETDDPAAFWVQKAMLATLVLFPYFLYRFMRLFVRPIPWIKTAASMLTAVLVLGALMLPSIPEEGEPQPGWFQVYVAALLIQWVFLSGLVAVRLWRAGRDQPSVARRRMRMLSLGAAGLALALVVAGEFSNGGTGAVVVQLLAVAAAPMMLIGFAPPYALRVWWHRKEEAALKQAELSLMEATSTSAVAATLLPRARGLLGGKAAVLYTSEGEVVASDGGSDPASEGSSVSISLGSHQLTVHASAFTPFFGREEISRLESFAALADLALARNALLGEQGRLAAIVRTSSDAIIAESLDGTITSWNEGAERIYGYHSEEAVGKPVSILVPPNVDDDVPTILAKVRAGESIDHYETKRQTKAGDVIDVSLSVSPLLNSAGEIVEASAIARDITEAVKLRAATEEQAEMLDIAQDAILARNLSGVISYWNMTAVELYGWTKTEAVGRSSHDLLQTRFPNSLENIEQALIRDGRWEGECVHKTRGGDDVIVACRWALRRDADGNPFQVIEVNNDITDQRKAEEALRENEAFLQTIYAASPDIITMMGLDGKFGMSSPASRDILGYEPEEYEQMDRMGIIHPEDRERVDEALRSLLQGSSAAEARCRVRHADGHWVVLEVRTRAIIDDEGQPCGFASVSRDVSDQVALEESLHEAREQAERANLAKSAFLSRMSHELRTPLNAILGFGQLLEMEQLSADQRDSTQQIIKGGHRLLGLINEVLDISRIESGTLRLSLEPVLVDGVVRDAVELIRPLADSRGIRLRSELTPDMQNRHVIADQQRFGQVLLNLLSNAVKYNVDKGTVSVTAVIDGDRICIGVTDTGPGIPEDKIPLLFTPFERLGAEQTGVEGTGLGLTLSRSLIEAMGGSLGVDTMQDQGMTFWIGMRATDGLSLESRATPTHQVDQPGAGGKVLYIEDNLSNLRLIERLVGRRAELELIPAMSGTLGIDLAQQHIPDLVLLDLHLPDLEGEEVLIRLRKDPRTRSIPVVILSADATPGQIERLRAAGADEYLTKPIDVLEFLALIDRILGPPNGTP